MPRQFKGKCDRKGRCHQHRHGQMRSFPLLLAQENEPLIVTDVQADDAVVQTLLDIGVMRGSEIEVIHKTPRSAWIIRTKQTKIIVSNAYIKNIKVTIK